MSKAPFNVYLTRREREIAKGLPNASRFIGERLRAFAEGREDEKR